MDFSISSELQATLDEVATFLADEVYPLEPAVIRDGFRASLPVLAEVREKVKVRGWWTPQMPKEEGGMGFGFANHARLSEVLGRSPLGHYLFNCQAPDAGNMEILHRFGSEEHKSTYLAPLIAGNIRSCFAMTEPDRAGSNPTWLDTRAEKDGDDYVITGRKWFTTAADGANVCIVMAVTNADAPLHMRASQIIVPTATDGFRRVRNISVMGEEGSDWASHSEVEFDHVRVPQSNRLGGEGAGFLIAQERLGPGRIHHCMRWLGICERAFELMVKRAVTREVAPGKPLGTRQLVQGWIADSRAEINAARYMVYHAAWKIDQVGAAQARDDISCIKFFVAGVLQKVLDRAIQAHGALGMTDDTPLAYFFRHERAARIYDGADEVHKQSLAKRILKQAGMVSPRGGSK